MASLIKQGSQCKKGLRSVFFLLLCILFIAAAAEAAFAEDIEEPAVTEEEAPAVAEDYEEYSKNIRGAVVVKKATVYEAESTDSEAIETLKFGEKMILRSGSGDWYEVAAGEITGYVRKSDVVKYNKKKKHIALTFDDGPRAATTKKVLKALDSQGCRATFFVLGSGINGSTKSLVKKAARMGCEIGNHSYNHPQLTKLSKKKIKNQLSKTDKKVKKITGKKPALCRAPYGAYSKKVLKAMNRPNIFWSLDTLDWKYRDTKRLIKLVTKKARDGQIVLMHDIHPTTAAAVNKICKNLKKKNFEMVTVTELAAIEGKKLKASKTYKRF